MTWGRSIARAASLLVLVPVAIGGCEDKKKPTGPGPTLVVGGVNVPTATPSEAPTEEKTKLPAWPEPSKSAAPTVTSVTIHFDAGRRAIAQAVDPDQAVVDAARVQAGHCFDGMPTAGAPERSATITVTVVGTRVTRTEVQTPGTSDAKLTQCLQGVGGGLTFPPKNSGGNTAPDVRTVTIDVSVSATR